MAMTRDNKSILAAWFAGVGLTVYRTMKYRTNNGTHISAPPSPGELLKTVGFFGTLALVNEAVSDDAAHHAIALLAWGVDLAALINLVGGKPTPIAGGAWPPAITPNTLIIPDGNPSSAAATPTTPTPQGPGNNLGPYGSPQTPLGVPAPNQPFNPAGPG